MSYISSQKEPKIFFVRHAEPDLSVRDDMLRPLTEKGRADAKLITEAFKDKNIRAVYSSPYKRAYDRYIINYYNPDFGYEGFMSIIDKMPYILCFKFKGLELVSIAEVEL